MLGMLEEEACLEDGCGGFPFPDFMEEAALPLVD